MKFFKIFKIFKKGAKAASKSKGKTAAAGGFEWPSGVRIGVYGHANSGKTVYFTVLNEECKIAKDLQISVTDNATAGELLTNYRSIWGLGTSTDVGTMVDLRGEKKFPDPTETDRLLQFTAILDRSKKLPVVAFDYPGAAVSISDRNESREKVLDFMSNCHGILFFFDPKVLRAELQTQAHVASFVNMLELLAPVDARLPIPVALVITKADILDGFSGEDQAILVGPEDENLLSEDFELFLERILASNKISSNPAWAGTVRNILVKQREFLKVVIGRTLNFQIFFTSLTGQKPEKIGTDVGRSIYAPPAKISPAGVKEPFYWLLKSIVRNRRISRFRTVAKYVAMLSIIWMFVFSVPFLFHFKYLIPKATGVEDNIIEAYDGNILNTSSDERAKIISAYGRYERSWTVKWLFPRFVAPADRIRGRYGDFNLSEAIRSLDQVIGRFTSVVQDSNLWPKLNPSDTTIIVTEEHERLLADLERFHQGDDKSELFTRSDRVLQYWNLFTGYVRNRADSNAYNSVIEQVEFNNRTFGRDLSRSETQLGDALSNNLKLTTEKKVKTAIAKKAGMELGDVMDKINGNNDPAYRLGDAVTELRTIRAKLDPSVDADNIAAIDRYLASAKRWDKNRKYTYKVESIPGNGHLHIEVTGQDKDPTWSAKSQIIQGFEYSLDWKVGDNIHIALDTLNAPEKWGVTASDKKKLSGKYSLFNMEGEVSFDNLGQKVSIRFSPSLIGRLPELKK